MLFTTTTTTMRLYPSAFIKTINFRTWSFHGKLKYAVLVVTLLIVLRLAFFRLSNSNRDYRTYVLEDGKNEETRVAEFFAKHCRHPHGIPDSFVRIVRQPEDLSNFNFFVIVHSAVVNVERRRLIRYTWGDFSRVRHFPWKMKFLFMLANPSSSSGMVQDDVIRESNVFNDIILVDYEDHYLNITYKAVAAYRVLSKVEKIAYVMKVDDDTIVNLKSVVSFIERQPPTSQFVAGFLRQNEKPDRRIHLKDYWKYVLSYQEYPWDYFPSTVMGAGIILSGSLVDYISNQTYKQPFFRFDDVYIYGMCTLGAHTLEWKGLVEKNSFIEQLMFLFRAPESILFAKQLRSDTQYNRVWEALNAGTSLCSSSSLSYVLLLTFILLVMNFSSFLTIHF